MEGEINLKKLIQVFLRRKYTFIFVFCSIVLGVVIKTKLTPKTYVATSKILIKPSYIFLERRAIKEEWTEESCCEILKTKGFIEKAIEYMKEKEIKVSILEMPNSAEILINSINPVPVKNTNIIKINIHYGNSQEAAMLANGIAEAFVDYIKEVEKSQDKKTKEFVEKQLPQVKERLQHSEEKLLKFKEKEMILSAVASREAIQQHLSGLEKKYNATLGEIDIKNKTLAFLEEKLKKEKERLPEAIVKFDNPYLSNLRKQLLTLETQYSSYILAGIQKEHPELIKLREKIDETKQKLKELTEKETKGDISIIEPLASLEELYKNISQKKNELLALQAKKEALEEELKKYKEYAKKFPEKEHQLIQLEREREFNEKVYKRLLDTYEEVKLKEVSKMGRITIVEYATPPLFPEYPKPKRNLILAIIFGIGLGIAVVILKEHLDTTIKEIEEIKKENIPIIGTVPFHKEESVEDMVSLEGEFYKKIKVNLNFVRVNNQEIKTLLISSCNPGEGKTRIVANLGIIYAKSGKKTLIVEGDFRKPSLSNIFHNSNEKGLSNLLAGEYQFEDVIKTTNIENLYIISAGHIPPDPTKLIDSDNMKKLMTELKEKFDFIIIDSPPLGICVDGYILKNVADGVAIVIEINKTEKNVLNDTISSINEDNKFIGVIINKIKKEKNSYYKYKYYYYRKDTVK